MIITQDEQLIRSILEDKTVIQGFSDGKRLDTIYLDDSVYFYEKNIGLFPCKIKDNVISIHAAIPKKNRGLKAIRAAKNLCNYLIEVGFYVIARVRYTDKHVKRFVNMVGFVYDYDKDNYHIYRYV